MQVLPLHGRIRAPRTPRRVVGVVECGLHQRRPFFQRDAPILEELNLQCRIVDLSSSTESWVLGRGSAPRPTDVHYGRSYMYIMYMLRIVDLRSSTES